MSITEALYQFEGALYQFEGALYEFEHELPGELRIESIRREGVIWTVVLRDRLRGIEITEDGLTLGSALERAAKVAEAAEDRR